VEKSYLKFIELLDYMEIPYLKVNRRGLHILLANKEYHYLVINFGTTPIAMKSKGFKFNSVTAFSFIGAVKILEKYKQNKL
jgi:hypothetical protein